MSDAEIASHAVLRHFHNEFAPHISDAEYRLGMFIYMRTVAFNKSFERISIKHFCEGVYKRSAELATAGCNKKRSAVLSILNRLESLGIIIRTPVPGGFTEYGLNTVATSRVIAERKRLLDGEGSNIPDAPIQDSGPPPVQDSGRPTKTSNNKTNIPKGARARDGGTVHEMAHPNLTKVAGVAANTKAKTTERREVRKSKGGGESLQKAWLDAMQENFPGVPVLFWNKRQFSMVKLKIVDGLRQHKPVEFLEYAVEHWDDIMRTRFAKMASRPIAPNIEFLCRFVENFIEAFAEHKGGISRHRPVANVRDNQAEVEELRKQVEVLAAERDKAVQASKTSHTSRLDQIGQEASEAPKRRIVKPLKRSVIPPSSTGTLPTDWE